MNRQKPLHELRGRRVARTALLVALLGQAHVAPSVAQPKTGTVTGQVKGPDNQPLADVSVSLYGPAFPSGRAVLTNRDGRYQFSNIPEGSVYTLRYFHRFVVRERAGLQVTAGRAAQAEMKFTSLGPAPPDDPGTAAPQELDTAAHAVIGKTICATGADWCRLWQAFDRGAPPALGVERSVAAGPTWSRQKQESGKWTAPLHDELAVMLASPGASGRTDLGLRILRLETVAEIATAKRYLSSLRAGKPDARSPLHKKIDELLPDLMLGAGQIRGSSLLFPSIDGMGEVRQTDGKLFVLLRFIGSGAVDGAPHTTIVFCELLPR